MKRVGPILLSLLFAALAVTAASAQGKYPERSVRVLVPYAPGGATDIVARIVGDAFQKVTGQAFVVINKPGAFGLLALNSAHAISPQGAFYDPWKAKRVLNAVRGTHFI